MYNQRNHLKACIVLICGIIHGTSENSYQKNIKVLIFDGTTKTGISKYKVDSTPFYLGGKSTFRSVSSMVGLSSKDWLNIIESGNLRPEHVSVYTASETIDPESGVYQSSDEKDKIAIPKNIDAAYLLRIELEDAKKGTYYIYIYSNQSNIGTQWIDLMSVAFDLILDKSSRDITQLIGVVEPLVKQVTNATKKHFANEYLTSLKTTDQIAKENAERKPIQRPLHEQGDVGQTSQDYFGFYATDAQPLPSPQEYERIRIQAGHNGPQH